MSCQLSGTSLPRRAPLTSPHGLLTPPSHRDTDTGTHPTASPSSLYPLPQTGVKLSRTARAHTAWSSWTASRAGPFCSTERKLPLASAVVPMWSHSWPTGTPFNTRARRFDVAMRVQLEVPGVLNVQPRPTPVATVVKVCVNLFARCAAGLFAYQILDATLIWRMWRMSSVGLARLIDTLTHQFQLI